MLVEVTPSGVQDAGLLQRQLTTDADGCALATDLPAGRMWVESDRGGTLQPDVAAGATTTAELMIPDGLFVRGRVVDDAGAPVAAARVWLSEERQDYTDGRFVTCTDQDGRFTLRCVQPERFLSATAPGLLAAVVQPLRGDVGTAVDVELVLRGKGVSLLGRVVDPDGRPAAGARVQVGYRNHGGMVWDPQWAAALRAPQQLRTDARGDFRADGVEPGRRTAVWVRAFTCCVSRTVLVPEPSQDHVVNVQLQRGGTVAGQATDGNGQPVARAWIGTRCEGMHGFEPTDSGAPRWALSGAMTDAAGRYRIDALLPGTTGMLARAEEKEVRGEVAVAAGGTATWNPVLADLALRGRVVDEQDRPLAGFRVDANPPRGKGALAGTVTAADGTFACRATTGVRYVLVFYPRKDGNCLRPVATVRGVEPGGEELLVRVPAAALPSATITGVLLDSDGRPLAEGVVRLQEPGFAGEEYEDVDPISGRFRLGPLVSGTYAVGGRTKDLSRRSNWSAPFALAAGQELDLGVVQMPEPGSLRVTVKGPDGSPLDGAEVNAGDLGPWHDDLFRGVVTQQGDARIADLAPGPHRLRVGFRGLPDVYQTCNVVAGAETAVTVRLPNGVPVRQLWTAVTEPPPILVRLVWTRDGEPWQRFVNRIEGARDWLHPAEQMLPGVYEVTATSETGKQVVSRFVVSSGDPPDREVVVRLP